MAPAVRPSQAGRSSEPTSSSQVQDRSVSPASDEPLSPSQKQTLSVIPAESAQAGLSVTSAESAQAGPDSVPKSGLHLRGQVNGKRPCQDPNDYSLARGYQPTTAPVLNTSLLRKTTPPQSLTEPFTPELADFEERFTKAVLANKEHRAWDFIIPRRVERVRMDASRFRKLDQHLSCNQTDRRYPSISFNPHTSTAIVVWMPSAIHAAFGYPLAITHNQVISNLPHEISKTLLLTGFQKVQMFFKGHHEGGKEPDTLFKYEDQRGNILPTAAMEIGFGESYKDLCEDAAMWIEGCPDIRTVILIKVEEDPLYHSPFNQLQDDAANHLSFPEPQEIKESMVFPEKPNEPWGPLEINGVRWVGTITAFWEKWQRGDNGKAKQCGARSYFAPGNPPPPAKLSLKLSELYPLRDIDGGDTIFPLPFEEFKLALLRERKVMAKKRCAKALLEVKARENNP